MKWTKNQEEAINKKGEILVAAAAGSGKTAVLVERNIRKIITEKIDINKILAITFTVAAASEMKERILQSLYNELEKNENDNIKRQIRLLPKANISTIHSFCFNLIKENFFNLDFASDVSIGQTEELEILKQDALTEVLELEYENKDKDFLELLNTYSNYRDDNELREEILEIYRFLESIPFEKDWINEALSRISEENEDYAKTYYGSILVKEIKKNISSNILILKSEAEELSKHSELEKFKDTIYDDISILEKIIKVSDWDKLYEFVESIKFSKWPSIRGLESSIKDNAKAKRDIVKNVLTKIKETYLREKSDSIFEDNINTIKNVQLLFSLALKFEEKFNEFKSKKNILDFADLEKFALKLLLEKKNGKIVKTEIAEEISKKYVEIQVDEYQDINQLQDLIIWSISNNNVFRVGDLKQSIYKFRNANPDIFIDKYNKFLEINEKITENNKDTNKHTNENTEIGSKILLYQNFRSRKNIIDFCNDLFSKIMSEELGEVEYSKEEYLNYSADFDDSDIKTEIVVISKKQKKHFKKDEVDFDEEEEIDYELEDLDNTDYKNYELDNSIDEDLQELIQDSENIELEAYYIADKIHEMMNSKIQIKDKDTTRNIEYKDIVILLRSAKGRSEIIEKVLYEKGIPVYADSSKNFFDSLEIATVISLIKIVDNPLLDIDFVTVLRSYFGGFDLNEITEIRMTNKHTSMFESLLEYIEKSNNKKTNNDKSNNEKAKKFIEFLNDLKETEKYLGLTEMLNKILIQSGYMNYISLENNGELKKANLKLFLSRAENYESQGNIGLYRFIQYLEKLKLSDTDISTANIIGEKENVVRIMTIHASKGLEFPIVILANTNKRINTKDLSKNMLLSLKHGIGSNYFDSKRNIKYPTLIKEAIKIKMKEELIAEEMRVLYVALTRAKEKLVITSAMKDADKYLNDISNLAKIHTIHSQKEIKYSISPYILKTKTTYLDWILLSERLGLSNTVLHLVHAEKLDLIEKEYTKEILKLNINDFTNETIELLNKKLKNLEYKYSQNILSYTKVAASRVNISDTNIIEDNIKNIQMRKPNFMSSQDLTKSEIGSLTHYFLQKLEFNKIYTEAELNEELKTLIKKELLTQVEANAINIPTIVNFVNSDEYANILKSKQAKEKQFIAKFLSSEIKEIVNKENNSIQDILSEDSSVLVQGIIDLYYITPENKLKILDYKTDNADENTIKERYTTQMLVYRKALEKVLNRDVDHVLIYSTTNNKYIEI